MTDYWAQFQEIPVEKKSTKEKDSYWDQFEEHPESPKMRNKAYLPAQLGLGVVEMSPPNALMEVLKTFLKGSQKGFFVEQRMEDPDLNYEAFTQGSDKVINKIPALSSLIDGLAKNTSIDLHPQSELEKVLRLAGNAGYFPKTLGNKILSSVLGAGLFETQKQLGVPEPVAELTSLLGSTALPGLLQGKVKKFDSGLTKRNLQKINKSTSMTPTQKEKLLQTLRQEGQDLSQDLLEKYFPQYQEITQNPGFIQALEKDFEDIANTFSTASHKSLPTRDLQDKLRKLMHKEMTSSLYKDPGQKTYLKTMQEAIKDLHNQPTFSTADLLNQYRRNNLSLKNYYDSTLSSLQNKANKKALLDQQQAIKELLQEAYAEDPKVFKKFLNTNASYENVKSLEKISSSFDKAMSSSDPSHNMNKLLNDKRFNETLLKSMGKTGADQFKTLIKDYTTLTQNLPRIKESASGFKILKDHGWLTLLLPNMLKVIPQSMTGWHFLHWLRREFIRSPQKHREWRNLISAIQRKDMKSLSRFAQLLDPTMRKIFQSSTQNDGSLE